LIVIFPLPLVRKMRVTASFLLPVASFCFSITMRNLKI
jgi:hypothetical protein